MSKYLFIAEKPSVAREFGRALKEDMRSFDGYQESEHAVVTWCVGHLVTMSYPEAYDVKYKKWSLSTLPFLPKEFKYEVIPGVKKQFDIVSRLLNRADVDVIYICTDSGREGEYIYRLVDQMAKVDGKTRKRVWIDSQTEEEILRGIREAKDWSAYDNLSASAYLRAKEDYLMGINFSRLLTLKYGNAMASFLNQKYVVVSVGRVMTCVLGMVVRREREIRAFVKTPFYRVFDKADLGGMEIEGEWRVTPGSRYDTGRMPSADAEQKSGKQEMKADFSTYGHPKLYKENGFRRKEDASQFIEELRQIEPQEAEVVSVERRKEKKNPPLLYNLAELQNECAKFFRISPDETLKVVQELYEKKLVTYPRTDARVLTTAVAKEIQKNISGLRQIGAVRGFAEEILTKGSYKNIAKTRYTNDKLVTDHYAIIPTGQGFGAMKGINPLSAKVYEVIVRRFLAIFMEPAVYQKVSLTVGMEKERFFSNFKTLAEEGYLRVMHYSFRKKDAGTQKNTVVPEAQTSVKEKTGSADRVFPAPETEEEAAENNDASLLERVSKIRKGMRLPVKGYAIKEGETSPPKRYNSGSVILAMENAGQLIEDEELRAQIKSCGIGTSATRAEILKKLVGNKYLSLNKKTQIITPALLGEMIYDVVESSIRSLLNPELTASWEKGLNYVAEGTVTPEEYMEKLDSFIERRTSGVMRLNNQYQLRAAFEEDAKFYKKPASERTGKNASGRGEKAASGRGGKSASGRDGNAASGRGERTASGKGGKTASR
ncbi:MAG: type IA DNA topoisomerase [Lachnospiraceae bacterium]|nr:type IA DNA topoisomerase [Lachnospiraceae bacterium]